MIFRFNSGDFRVSCKFSGVYSVIVLPYGVMKKMNITEILRESPAKVGYRICRIHAPDAWSKHLQNIMMRCS